MTASFSPATLSYVAALRGIKAAHPGEAFTYAMAECAQPEFLIALAASNPEGKFYGTMSDSEACNKAIRKAAERQVGNVSFIDAPLESVLAGNKLPPLDYMVADAMGGLSAARRQTLAELAQKSLKPGGLVNLAYRAYTSADEAMKFIVREFGPEMNAEQACDFLLDLKKLGHLYLPEHADIAAKLDHAIAKNMPDDFFALFDGGEANSPTFDTVVAMRSRGFAFAGDSRIRSNYVELSLPAEAQETVISCRDNPLYEAIKDFAALNGERYDLWCKLPAQQSADPSQLFGCFAYGLTAPEKAMPESVQAFGKTVDLSAPVYQQLAALMQLQPVGIGDALNHPDTSVFPVDRIVESLQVLCALDLVRPMRGAREASSINSLAQPRFCGSFNRYLDRVAVAGEALAMASRIVGDVVLVPPRDVLVMQALNRAGLANSVSALLPELERLAKDPASAHVADAAEPTAEDAHRMITDTVSESIVRWYAYGLLEAA